MSIHGGGSGDSGPPSTNLSVLRFFLRSPSVALGQQLESVSGKTQLVVHALWDAVATASARTDSGTGGTAASVGLAEVFELHMKTVYRRNL